MKGAIAAVHPLARVRPVDYISATRSTVPESPRAIDGGMGVYLLVVIACYAVTERRGPTE